MTQLKKCKVVMLPTNQKADVNSLLIQNNKLSLSTKVFQDAINRRVESNPDSSSCIKNQHLYILSDDEIKEGDYFYYPLINSVREYLGAEDNLEISRHKVSKVIASTDMSLTHLVGVGKNITSDLPHPSQSFIEKYVEEYNKGNVITDVLVEYTHLCKNCGMKMRDNGCIAECGKEYIEVLYTNPKDNTITIKKVKDSWSKEEVNNILNTVLNNILCRPLNPISEDIRKYPNSNKIGDYVNKWIEENL